MTEDWKSFSESKAGLGWNFRKLPKTMNSRSMLMDLRMTTFPLYSHINENVCRCGERNFLKINFPPKTIYGNGRGNRRRASPLSAQICKCARWFSIFTQFTVDRSRPLGISRSCLWMVGEMQSRTSTFSRRLARKLWEKKEKAIANWVRISMRSEVLLTPSSVRGEKGLAADPEGAGSLSNGPPLIIQFGRESPLNRLVSAPQTPNHPIFHASSSTWRPRSGIKSYSYHALL